MDTTTCTAYTSRTYCLRLLESRRPGCFEEDQFQPVKDTSPPAVTENVKEALASGQQLTSSAGVQHVIRNLLNSSCLETILSGTTSGETSAGARRNSGLRARHNTVGLLQLERLGGSVNRYFEEKGFKSVVFLGTAKGFDALGRVHIKLTKQKQNRSSAFCDKSATILQHL